jgi:hypothetical protein
MEKITDKYYLGSNKSTFILYEKKISSSGKENYKNIGYLASLDAVYNTLIEKEIREDLSLINNIEKICDMINELKEFTINYIEKDNK